MVVSVWLAAVATVPCLYPTPVNLAATLCASWLVAVPLRTATVTDAGLNFTADLARPTVGALVVRAPTDEVGEFPLSAVATTSAAIAPAIKSAPTSSATRRPSPDRRRGGGLRGGSVR